MGLETLAVVAVYSLFEYLIGKSKKIKSNSIPEATIEKAAKAVVDVGIKVVSKLVKKV